MDFKSSLNNIFESLLTKEPLFHNKDVLRHSYTPDELPHREYEIKQLASIIVPALKGQTPSNILIYGKSGTGKTIVSKFLCSELEKTGRRVGMPISVVYLNCEVTDTRYRILANLANHFGKDVPFTGWPTDKVYNTFKDEVDKEKQSILIILDEIDKLVGKKGDNLIYNLTRINSELSNAKVSLIGISNDLKFKDYLDSRVLSSLGAEDVIFRPYNASDLEDILNQRATLAFVDSVLDENVVPLCAALAAREHGDARKALDLLRVSGEEAEKEAAEQITEAHVRRANDKIEKDTTIEAIRTLPTQSKVLLYATVLLEERGTKGITTGEVYDIYKRLCRNISLDVLTQRRISDLLSELDNLGILSSKVISKGRYGRTKEIRIDISPAGIRAVLTEDMRLRKLTDIRLPQTQLL